MIDKVEEFLGDAEENARLRAALEAAPELSNEQVEQLTVGLGAILPTVEIFKLGWRTAMRKARAALACRPQEKHTVLDDIAAERRRQVDAEGWTADHDDTHAAGELACAAACYAEGHLRHCWPWDRQWWKPTTPRQNYIKAAALLIAEIERLDRLACRPQGERSET